MGMDETIGLVVSFASVLYAPTDLIEVRMIPMPRGGEVPQLWVVARDIGSVLPRLAMANTEGRFDIYVGVNPRIREGGKEEDVAMARCLFADWDDLMPAQLAERIAQAQLPEPTMVIHSGHGVHAYWRLAEPMTDLKLWKAAQQRIIDRAGSDNKIKDPPRVMRLPGFLNLPDDRKDETEAVPCTIHSLIAERAYTLEQVVGKDVRADLEAVKVPAVGKAGGVDRQQLSRSTLEFVFGGAPDGQRQTRCFHAACDMAGCGYSMGEAEAKLLPGADVCGLPRAEAQQAIRSAYGKSRSPAIPPDTDGDEIGSALQRAAGATGQVKDGPAPPRDFKPEHAGASAPAPAPATKSPEQHGRLTLSNVRDSRYKPEGSDEYDSIRYFIPLPEISRHLAEATGGWPRRAGGVLFAVRDAQQPIPDSYCVQYLSNVDKLFAWIGASCDTRWAGGDVNHPVSKAKLNPPTKREFYEYLSDNAKPTYRAVEILPHHPPIEDLYYLPCNLPELPAEADTPLKVLVRRFNPETEVDRMLMLAALITPGWGGPPGARPAFVFTSEHGRGVGKTATATVMAEVWGGAISIGAKEDWDQVRKRLLGDDSLSKRITIIDNLKGRLSDGNIEGFITSKDIDGWKPYHGQASRPNLLTWYLTANSPSLSRDLADRAVVIKIGHQQHASDFIRWAQEFIREHRPAILAEAFAILRDSPLCEIEPESRDRWGAWQDAVLARFEEGNLMAQAIKGRRGDVDADTEDAEDIAKVLFDLVSEYFRDHELRAVLITRQQLYNRLMRDGLIDKNFSPRSVVTWIKERCGSGPLACLSERKTMRTRLWLYVGKSAAKEQIEHPDSIPEIGNGASGA